MRGALYFNRSSGSQRVNPEEVKATAREAGLDFVALDRAAGIEVEADVRRRIHVGQKLFVAAGGDGTINHVAQPIVNSPATLGILPIGTFNHFARDLNLPLEWRKAFDVATKGPTRHIDVARVNDRYFLNNISLGLYPELVQHREKFRSRSKIKAYLFAGVQAMRKFPHVSLMMETPQHFEVLKTHIFMVSVNPYDLSRIGLVAPRVSLQAGRLSVYWLPHMPKPAFIRVLARYVRGRMDEGEFRFIHTTQVKVRSSRESLPVGMDGELFSMHPPLTITIAPRSLAVKVVDSRAIPRGIMAVEAAA